MLKTSALVGVFYCVYDGSDSLRHFRNSAPYPLEHGLLESRLSVSFRLVE